MYATAATEPSTASVVELAEQRISVAGEAYIVANLGGLIRRFSEDPGFRIILGCTKCKTEDGALSACIASVAECACCVAALYSRSASTNPHKRLILAADLIEKLQFAAKVPTVFTADFLKQRREDFPASRLAELDAQADEWWGRPVQKLPPSDPAMTYMEPTKTAATAGLTPYQENAIARHEALKSGAGLATIKHLR